MESLFRIEGLRYSYAGAGTPALDISLHAFEEGAIHVLVGPNGSGKSTLLKVLGFLLEPTAGRLLFRGEDPHEKRRNLTDLRREVPLLLQDPYLFRGTVASNVAWGLSLRGIPREERERRISEALRIAGLPGFEKRDARRLSGGESRKAALARLAALRPKVLLLDEPTAGIDPASAREIEDAIRGLVIEEGLSVILATHDPEQARRLAARVVAMRGGRILGVSVENVFRGRIVVEVGETFFDTGRIRLHATDLPPTCDMVALSPDAILVSREPFASSARNHVPGTVSEARVLDSRIELVVRARDEAFRVHLTRRSFEELGIRLGEEVYLTFKASSLVALD